MSGIVPPLPSSLRLFSSPRAKTPSPYPRHGEAAAHAINRMGQPAATAATPRGHLHGWKERSPTPSPAGKAACVDEKSIRRQYPRHRRDEPQSGRSRRQNVPRHGLHCRINAFPLSIPQLAARRSDVELLADHFLHTFSAALGKHMQAINAKTRNLLCRYPWPGNVREQENAIGLAVNVCGGQELMPCGFPSAMFRYGPASGPGRKNGWLWMQETETIRKAIRETDGNRAGHIPGRSVFRLTLSR